MCGKKEVRTTNCLRKSVGLLKEEKNFEFQLVWYVNNTQILMIYSHFEYRRTFHTQYNIVLSVSFGSMNDG